MAVTIPTLAPARLAISASGVQKSFAGHVVLDRVDLAVAEGTVFALLGPNGAGKTTTVEMLNGLTEPTDGRIFLLDEQLGRDRQAALRRVQARIGVQLQESELPDRLTVRECLRLFRSFYPRGRSVDELLALLTLQEKQQARVSTLSGGQRQRLALACALAGAPEVLFLDEPTTGLDPQARLNVWEVIERFRADGGSVLVTTHYMEEAARLCDRVAIMDAGRIIAVDTPAHLIASLGAEVELSHSESDERFLAELPGVVSVRRRGRAFALATGSLRELLPRVLRACEERNNPITTLTTHAATLEDVFVALTGKVLRDG
jgi:ABC-2 type transport system ATP-binding protein